MDFHRSLRLRIIAQTQIHKKKLYNARAESHKGSWTKIDVSNGSDESLVKDRLLKIAQMMT